MGKNPELSAKPIGLILPDDADIKLFYSLTRDQQGYILHHMRSNHKAWPTMQKMARKALSQRPGTQQIEG